MACAGRIGGGNAPVRGEKCPGLGQRLAFGLDDGVGGAEIAERRAHRIVRPGGIELRLQLCNGMTDHQHVETAALELAQPPQMRQEVLRDHQMGMKVRELPRIALCQRLVIALQHVLQCAALARCVAQAQSTAQCHESGAIL